MNSLSEIINVLSEAEKKEFILFMKKRNKRADTQNIRLFQMLKTVDIKLEIDAKENQSAHYALRKRLHKNLIEFIANKRFQTETSDEREVQKLIIASRVFFEQQLYKTAFKVLAKAEEAALKLERFNLLNEIYHTQIQYAYLDTKASFSELTEKYLHNQKKFLQEEQLNLAYASLRIELAKVREGSAFFDLEEAIRTTIARYDISLKDVLTYKSLSQILFIANEYAALQNSYHQLERFVQTSSHFIAAKIELAEKHLFYHIQILYFMANVLFRNKKFDASKKYLERMATEMQKQGGIYKPQFVGRLHLLRAMNANYSGNAEVAIALAEHHLSQNLKDNQETLDFQLALAVFAFQQHDLKKVLRIMKMLHHSDAWFEKKMGVEWTIKKNLMEILLHAELEHDDYALSRAQSFKRKYRNYLTEVNEARVLIFLGWVEKFLKDPTAFSSAENQNRLETAFQWKSHQEEDIFVMSFYAWLKAKVEKRNLYEVTLDLVGKR